jgi:hypothetical protein
MTILETNSKNLNDKIQAFRDLNLGLIKGLQAVHGIDELNITLKALELSNLYAWNAQMVNDSYEVTPKIECHLTLRATKSFLEVINNDVKLTLEILECIRKIVAFLPDFFEKLETMDDNLIENCKEYSDAEFDCEARKIASVEYSMKRVLDCLSDATLWTNLYFERIQS